MLLDKCPDTHRWVLSYFKYTTLKFLYHWLECNWDAVYVLLTFVADAESELKRKYNDKRQRFIADYMTRVLCWRYKEDGSMSWKLHTLNNMIITLDRYGYRHNIMYREWDPAMRRNRNVSDERNNLDAEKIERIIARCNERQKTWYQKRIKNIPSVWNTQVQLWLCPYGLYTEKEVILTHETKESLLTKDLFLRVDRKPIPWQTFEEDTMIAFISQEDNFIHYQTWHH